MKKNFHRILENLFIPAIAIFTGIALFLLFVLCILLIFQILSDTYTGNGTISYLLSNPDSKKCFRNIAYLVLFVFAIDWILTISIQNAHISFKKKIYYISNLFMFSVFLLLLLFSLFTVNYLSIEKFPLLVAILSLIQLCFSFSTISKHFIKTIAASFYKKNRIKHQRKK